MQTLPDSTRLRRYSTARRKRCESHAMESRLTPELAEHFATIALGHVGREYPNKLDHVLSGPGDLATPRSG